MNFKEAMGHFKNGFKIRRESWKNKTYYLSRHENLASIDIDSNDIDATDWEIYKDPIPYDLEEMIYFVWDDLGFGHNSQSRFYDSSRIKSYDELLHITLDHCLNNDPTIYKEIMEFIRDRHNRNGNV